MSVKLGKLKQTVPENEENSVKIVLVGDSGVGKSCLLDKFLDTSSTNNFISTIGVDVRTRILRAGEKTVRIQVWDTGGQQRYRPVLASCYRGAVGVIIVFDLTNRRSFQNIKQWLVEVEEFSSLPTVQRLLVGNKADLTDRREVEEETAAQFAKELGIQYIETSVQEKSNIQEAFLRLVRVGNFA